MNARTEELLYVIMWTTETLARPTYRGFSTSFDEWARISGLERRLYLLRQKGLVEHVDAPVVSHKRLLRLTDKGWIAAQGGEINAAERWKRRWDGRWRMVLFDLPAKRTALRHRLWRFLRMNRFGYLQNSVWITPDTTETLRERMKGEKSEVGSLLLMEGRPCGGESDFDVVAEAWNFAAINERYRRYLTVAKQMPSSKSGFGPWREWLMRERETWLEAVRDDPFLPEALLHADYLGKRAWEFRQKRLRGAVS